MGSETITSIMFTPFLLLLVLGPGLGDEGKCPYQEEEPMDNSSEDYNFDDYDDDDEDFDDDEALDDIEDYDEDDYDDDYDDDNVDEDDEFIESSDFFHEEL